MRRTFALSCALAVAVCALLFLLAAARPAAAQPGRCAVGDVNCDGRLDVVDLQRVAASFGSPAAGLPDGARLDVDGDGAIGLPDLELARPAWRMRSAPSASGPPRLGYAVDAQGQVFLRWHLPVSPYSATVQILRQPAPAGAPPTGRPDVGVLAEVGPIYDDATALPLLGSHWDTLRVAFATELAADGSQVAVALQSVAEMHDYASQGANPMVVQQLSNQAPGVAQVMGLGYLDTAFTSTGVYTYWVRVNGRLVGPVRVDTGRQTNLPPPADVLAFEGTANVTGTVGTWGHQSQLRIAHASAFLTWDPSLGRRPAHPVWQNGFNVYRKECDPGPVNCGAYTRLNELPVLPQPLPADALASESFSATGLVSGTQVSFGVESQEFSYYWADRGLNTDKEYCYQITALDLLGQDGRPSAETAQSCLQPPDYLPPTTPEIISLEPEHYEGGANMFVSVRTPPQSNPRNTDLFHFQIYTASSATAAWPAEWSLMGTFDANTSRPRHRFLAAQGMREHEQRWFRVIGVDRAGNPSAPGAPVLGTVDDTEPPAPPLPCPATIGQPPPPPGCLRFDADTALINIYRKFGPDGIPLLVEQLPLGEFDWGTWQDSYTPAQSTTVYYELRALDEAANLSAPSLDFRRTLSPAAVPLPSPPVIDGISWAKNGPSYDATISWSQVGMAGVADFTVYRSEGSAPPDSLDDMTPIEDGIIAVLIGLAYERRYSFTDTGLEPNELYWYAVEAKGPGAAGGMPSEPRASRYIAVGPEPEHPILPMALTATLTADGVQLRTLGDRCCFVFLRSRDGVSNFSQITPLIYDGSYLDTDVRAGEPAFYQALWVDAGSLSGGAIDFANAGGEILGASNIVSARIPGIPALPPPAPLAPPPQSPLPANAPASLQFGPSWRVQVRSYDAGSTLASASGDGAVMLTVGPGDTRPVWVQFDDIQINAAGQVLAINPGGGATVEIGPALIPTFTDRFSAAFTNMRLDTQGALSNLSIIGYGPGMQAWDITPAGPGEPIPAPLPDQRISNPQLEWSRQVTFHVGQGCAQAPDTIALPFAVSDWPLYIVPTEPFTLTHNSMQFGATCTLYRDRYSGVDAIGNPISRLLDYRNDGFLRPSYSGSGASYGFSTGLSGSWSQSGAHTYTAAWPFAFELSSNSRSLTFAGGALTGGSIADGSIAFAYARSLDVRDTNSFSGSFASLALGPGGALLGTVTSPAATEWLTFAIDRPDYSLYVPAALTRRAPGLTWPAAAGAQGSGVPGSGRDNPGLNAGDRDLSWTLCPNATLSTATLTENAASRLDLYVRRSGVSGRVDFTPDPLIDASVSGYKTQFTRFAYSWLSNLGVTSGIAGRFVLPFPANISLDFDTLELDDRGCIAQGDVLPGERTLDYWNLGVLPQSVDLRPGRFSAIDLRGNIRTNYTLWLVGDYDIPNLAQAEGDPAASPSLIAMEAAFAPDGNFLDAEVFPEEMVYTVDGFYTVVSDLRLSDYVSREAPGWDTSMTIEQPPGAVDGFIELTGGVYLPYFGEASDPDTAKIYLLGDHPYVGFDRRPHAERFLSEQLKLNMAYDLAYAQAAGAGGSRWLALASEATRGLDIAGLTILETPHALIATPEETRLVFGFPAPAALFLAAEEAYLSWDAGRGEGDAERFEGWRTTLAMTSSLDLLGDVYAADAEFAERLLDQGMGDYTALIAGLNAALDNSNQPPAWLEDAEVATLRSQIPLFPGIMAKSPLQAQYLRGDAVILPVTDEAGRVIDGQLDLIQIGTYVQVYQSERDDDPDDPEGENEARLLEATLTLAIDPQGSVYLGADDVQSSLLEQRVSADADMRLLFSDTLGYGMEGGITLRNLETPGVEVTRAGAVAGFTLLKSPARIGLLYVGATLDARVDLASLGPVDLGGSFLYGRLDPGSPVLAETYGDLFDDMEAPAGEIIQGGYFMAYANDIPIYNVGAGCVGVQVSGGGEVALWAFNKAGTSDSAWGVRLGVNAMGEAFCVAVAKADVTLQLDNDFGEDSLDLTGTAWAGAGCGSCEPEDWDTPADVEGDSWCLKCIIDLYFKIPLAGSTSKSEFDFSASCPF